MVIWPGPSTARPDPNQVRAGPKHVTGRAWDDPSARRRHDPLLTAGTLSVRYEKICETWSVVMWLVKLVIFYKWNMIFEYIMLCVLWNINVYELNVIYLCFVKLYIKFNIFHITGYGPTRSTIRPRAFRAGPARKPAHSPCLRRQAGTMAYGDTARWHTGQPVPYQTVPSTGPCRARPGRPVDHLYGVGDLLILAQTAWGPRGYGYTRCRFFLPCSRLQQPCDSLPPPRPIGSCLVCRKFYKIFQILRHIESLDTYMEY